MTYSTGSMSWRAMASLPTAKCWPERSSTSFSVSAKLANVTIFEGQIGADVPW
ncbi:Uncharacterised protein [Mycobacteroides abscessus subsp. abscessus]|nr:Uncharacterised protein [Mycobacteroides abscessus subsp. abscessus]